MASKQKFYWYVIVLTGEGAKFVTSIDNSTKTAHWDGEKAPYEMGRFKAEDLSLGLMVNGYLAYAVMCPIEVEHQPYFYKKGHFEWVWNEESKESEDDDK